MVTLKKRHCGRLEHHVERSDVVFKAPRTQIIALAFRNIANSDLQVAFWISHLRLHVHACSILLLLVC